MEGSLLAELGEPNSSSWAPWWGWPGRCSWRGCGSHVGGDGLDVAVDGVESLGVSARLDESGGVAVGDGAGLWIGIGNVSIRRRTERCDCG